MVRNRSASANERVTSRIHDLLKIPRWGYLRVLGNSRLIRTSYIWLLVVPVAAHLFLPIAGPQTLSFSWLDKPITLNLGLPFRWYIFYAMAMSFAIAQAIYYMQCPWLVRRFSDWSDFSRSHPGTDLLGTYVVELLSTTPPTWCSAKKHLEFQQKGLRAVASSMIQVATTNSEQALRLFYDSQKSDASPIGLNSDLFNIVLRYHAEKRLGSAAVSAVFFALGIVLFGYVIIEGAFHVGELVVNSKYPQG